MLLTIIRAKLSTSLNTKAPLKLTLAAQPILPLTAARLCSRMQRRFMLAPDLLNSEAAPATIACMLARAQRPFTARAAETFWLTRLKKKTAQLHSTSSALRTVQEILSATLNSCRLATTIMLARLIRLKSRRRTATLSPMRLLGTAALLSKSAGAASPKLHSLKTQ